MRASAAEGGSFLRASLADNPAYLGPPDLLPDDPFEARPPPPLVLSGHAASLTPY